MYVGKDTKILQMDATLLYLRTLIICLNSAHLYYRKINK